MVEDLRKLLGVEGRDAELEFVVGFVRDAIESYCNVDEICKSLRKVFLKICVDVFREEFGRGGVYGVSGIAEGDVRVQFAPGRDAESYLRPYLGQLRAKRKVRW